MGNFITGKDLEDAVYNIIWDAEQTLLIVSPFIKLDDYFKKLFDKHINNPKIHFIVVFGKNEWAVSKSMSKADFDYFKKFLNISVVYVPNLHAKYYGNEHKGVITSINLYDYSFKNNIEFGVYSEVSLLNKLTTTTDQEAWSTCIQIAENNEAVFIKRPVYEKKMLSALIGKSYIKSDTLHDNTERFYSGFGFNKRSMEKKRMNDFPESLELGSAPSVRPTREEVEQPATGFCIRTGERIPFNPKRPLSEKAYKSWVQFGNPDYPEKYCHLTGKSSNGKTSVNRPIL
jgi:hypothetical protein